MKRFHLEYANFRIVLTEISILVLFVFLLFPSSLGAVTLKEALSQAAEYFTKTAVKIDPNKKMFIQVKNLHNEKRDAIAKKIETALYFALEEHFSDFKMFLEPAQGNEILLEGTYEKKGNLVTIRLRAFRNNTQGEILGSFAVEYEEQIVQKRTLVVVLDLEAEQLSSVQRKAYSDFFRSALDRQNVFDMASSSEVDKMDADEIQKSTGCTRDTCATIIGEQMGVDRVISSSLFKMEESSYMLSAKMMDIADGSILKQVTVEHSGDLGSLTDSLEILAAKLTGTEAAATPVQTEETGSVAFLHLRVTPADSTIEIDGKGIGEEQQISISNVFETRELKMPLPLGRHKIRASHPQAERPTEITANLEQAGETYEENIEVMLNRDYMVDAQYADDLSSWRWKFWTLTFLTLATSATSVGINYEAQSTYDRKVAAESALLKSASEEEAKRHYALIEEDNEKIRELNSASQYSAGLSALLFCWTLWVWIDDPDEPDGRVLGPYLQTDGKMGLTYSVNW